VSLLGKLTEKAAGEVDARAVDWLGSGIDRARDLASENLAGGTRKEVLGALGLVEQHKGALSHLGSGAVAGVLVGLVIGAEEEARLVYLATGSSFEERRRASTESTAAVTAEREAREAEWEEIKEMAKVIGKAALGLVTTLLIGAL